jgi:hypothetical protein
MIFFLPFLFETKPPSEMNEQLTFSNTFNPENLIFQKSKECKIPNSELSYFRIGISVKYNDGSTGPLIIPTGQLYSFGVSENKSLETRKTTGYSLSLCLHNRDGPTDDEIAFEKAVTQIVETAKKHMLQDEIKKSVKQYKLIESDLRKLDPIYRKEVEGQVVEGQSPVLYPKLITSKTKDGNIHCKTVFFEEDKFDNEGEPKEIDYKLMISQSCYVRAAIKFESIYIGSGKIRLQIKVSEGDVHLLSSKGKSLLRRKRVGGGLRQRLENQASKEQQDGDGDGDGDGSEEIEL